jgi:hypothetical protein
MKVGNVIFLTLISPLPWDYSNEFAFDVTLICLLP